MKKLLTLLLAFSMLCTMALGLVACGGEEEETKESDPFDAEEGAVVWSLKSARSSAGVVTTNAGDAKLKLYEDGTAKLQLAVSVARLVKNQYTSSLVSGTYTETDTALTLTITSESFAETFVFAKNADGTLVYQEKPLSTIVTAEIILQK